MDYFYLTIAVFLISSTHLAKSEQAVKKNKVLTSEEEIDLIEKSCDGAELCMKLVQLARSNFTATGRSMEDLANFRRLRQLKAFILHLQPEHRFARYCFYGCYCLPDTAHKLYTVGYGTPVDPIDNSCRKQSKCYECAQLDHPDRSCTHDRNYGYQLTVDAEDPDNHWKKGIVCTDDNTSSIKNSCKRSICECDKQLAEDLREHFSVWYAGHHQEQGDFDSEAQCIPPSCKNGNCPGHAGPVKCCGKTPGARFPYKSLEGQRQCCGDKTFDSNLQECCDDSKLASFGSC